MSTLDRKPRSVNFQSLRTSDTEASARKVMQANRKVDGAPELRLRRALWAAGIRGYRKNYRELPGRPDVAFTRSKVLVDLRGCFWHNCPVCRAGKRVEKNAEYWFAKVARNVERDAENEAAWSRLGYTVLVVWEHEVKADLGAVVQRIRQALTGSPAENGEEWVPPEAARGHGREVGSEPHV